jgi:hypothetical protein
MGTKKNIFFPLLFLCLFFLLLFTAEAILALLNFKPLIDTAASIRYPQNMSAYSLKEMIEKGFIKGEYGYLKPDNDLGYTYYTEPHGFLDPKNFYDDWSKYTRILILGDSFVEGATATPQRGFIQILEGYYKERGVIIFNGGVGGYSQNNELAFLKRYCDVIKPHLVILCFYPGNDFYENLSPVDRYTGFPGVWIPKYEVLPTQSGVKIRHRPPQEIFELYQSSVLYPDSPQFRQSLKKFITYRFLFRWRLGTLVYLAYGNIRCPSPKQEKSKGYLDFTYRTTRDCMLRIKEYLAKRNIPFHIFLVPHCYDSTDTLKRTFWYYKGVALCNELKIPYLDPFDSFALEDYYFKYTLRNDHWNDIGHFKAYLLLKDYIDEILKGINKSN